MISPDFLKNKNPHIRDSSIEFEPTDHIYTIDGEKGYISVTTWNHSHFEQFNSDKIIKKMMSSKKWKDSKYFGMTVNDIKHVWNTNKNESAHAGTKLHYDIECFYNNMDVVNDSIEYKYFKQFHADHNNIVPYRTEWMIYDKKHKFAGSIDMTVLNPDGTFDLYDWKRSKQINKEDNWGKKAKTICIQHLDDCNYIHYCLQLHTYKKILETNYEIKIKNMYLVCLHPNNTNHSYIKYEVKDLSKEVCDLCQLRMCELNNSLEYKLPKLIQQFIKNKSDIVKLQKIHNSLLKEISNIDDEFEEEIELEEKDYNGKKYNVDTFNNYIYNNDGILIGVWDIKPKLFA